MLIAEMAWGSGSGSGSGMCAGEKGKKVYKAMACDIGKPL